MNWRSCSDAFLLSQYRYYGAHLGGQYNGINNVRGLYQQTSSECLSRGLLRVNPSTNQYEE